MVLGATDRLRVEERGVSETGWCLLHYRVGEKFLLPNMEGVICSLFVPPCRAAMPPNRTTEKGTKMHGERKEGPKHAVGT